MLKDFSLTLTENNNTYLNEFLGITIFYMN